MYKWFEYTAKEYDIDLQFRELVPLKDKWL